MDRRRFLQTSAALCTSAHAAPAAPAPYGPLPSRRQLQWHQLEVYSFLHFTVNTFTDKEWGYGDESPNLFNPLQFEAAAIIDALRAGGMKGVILTCKHHDGFCLWPTKTTEHSVRSSTWRNGKGDVVKEISEAARKAGLRFGVYLSPWDRNHRAYGKPEYVQAYREQLRELLTNYGPIYEVWHDGANGGDGFYGGAREKRFIDKRTYYDWPNTWELVRQLQPDAVIFSDVGPDIRWVGNEKGFANETCWATFEPVAPDGGPPAPGFTRDKEATTGHRNGSKWLPPECDVSIRPGWFFHEKENGRVKTSAQLMDLYYKSVGRGGSFLLNVPPDRRGLLHENDVASLKGFGEMMGATFAQDLALKSKITAPNTRSKDFPARNLLDSNRDSYWASADGVHTPELIIELASAATFNVIRLREAIALGQRVDAFAIDQWQDNEWVPLVAGTSIGSCRILRTPQPVTAKRLRLRITQSAAPPVLAEFGLFRDSL